MSESPRPLWEVVEKHVKTVREFVEHSQDSGDPGGGCQRCWDLFARVTKEADELAAALRAWDEELSKQGCSPRTVEAFEQVLGVPPKEPEVKA